MGDLVPTLVGEHPLVESIRLSGSRASGAAHDLSDWDFIVRASDFDRLRGELPSVVEPLRPLVQQWDRYSNHACYMLVLRGPTKVDLIFPDERQEWAPAWTLSRETLPAIDRHFWDWTLWLEQKRRSGRDDAVAKSLVDMYLLKPMGARTGPDSVAEAVEAFVDLRDQLEERLGVRAPRELEREVRPVVAG